MTNKKSFYTKTVQEFMEANDITSEANLVRLLKLGLVAQKFYTEINKHEILFQIEKQKI